MFGTTLDFLLVLLGFGFIVFIHELGHFLAARWAGIRVLAFSVGFGPALVSFRKGMGLQAGSSEKRYLEHLDRCAGGSATAESLHEANRAISPTEYRLNALPFGGYVKMLGQEDGNPYAVSDAPDSYQSCKPWKRMIVISAGVVMNIILAAILFVFVFMVGMKVPPATVGAVAPGSPAALTHPLNGSELGVTHAGLQGGDVILAINGEKPNSFSDLMLAASMAEKNSLIDLKISRPGIARPLNFLIRPEVSRTSGLLEIGIEPPSSVTIPLLTNPKDAAEAAVAFKSLGLEGVEPGMTLATVNGQSVSDGTALFSALRESNGHNVAAEFRDEKKTVTVELSPKPQLQLDHLPRGTSAVIPVEHLLGLTPVMMVADKMDDDAKAIAEKQGLKEGDIFARVGGVEYPSFAQGISEIQGNKGRSIPLVVLRRDGNGELKEVSLPRVEVNSKGQIGFNASDTGKDAAIISGPLAGLVHPGQTDRFTPPAAAIFDTPGTRILSVNNTAVSNFADLRAALRTATATALSHREGATLNIKIRRPVNGVLSDGAPVEELQWVLAKSDVAALYDLGWESRISPGLFEMQTVTLKAASPRDALRMGFAETKRVMLTTYITFARLVQGTVKVEHLKGPVGIAHLGTLIAGRGVIWLLFFLALISVNLAVINFLPLPIVDGGQFLFILFEQIRGKPVPLGFQNAATLAGLTLIGCVFLVVTYNDIKNLLGF